MCERASDLKSELLQSKRHVQLLDDLPQHWLATRRETLLQAVASCHKIVHLHTRFEGMRYRQSMGEYSRPLLPVRVVKTALISIDAIA
jgi:hypothetical protein